MQTSIHISIVMFWPSDEGCCW